MIISADCFNFFLLSYHTYQKLAIIYITAIQLGEYIQLFEPIVMIENNESLIIFNTLTLFAYLLYILFPRVSHLSIVKKLSQLSE